MTGDRERRDLGRDRLPRRRHVDDPRRRRRHHAAEPLAARDRRAVRHARVALSGPHRPRARPRARHRPAHAARAAPRPAERRATSRSDVQELQALLGPAQPRTRRSRPCPAAGLEVPLWILGSSIFGAQLAAAARAAVRVRLALRARPTCCTALALYRERVPAVGAARPSRTRWSASTSSPPTPTTRRGGCSRRCSRRSRTCCRGQRAARYQPPIDDIEAYWTPAEKAAGVARCSTYSVVGSPETVRAGLEQLPRAHRRRRADGRLGDLRPRRARAVVRDPGRADLRRRPGGRRLRCESVATRCGAASRGWSSGSPVSSSVLRPERIIGQPP